MEVDLTEDETGEPAGPSVSIPPKETVALPRPQQIAVKPAAVETVEIIDDDDDDIIFEGTLPKNSTPDSKAEKAREGPVAASTKPSAGDSSVMTSSGDQPADVVMQNLPVAKSVLPQSKQSDQITSATEAESRLSISKETQLVAPKVSETGTPVKAAELTKSTDNIIDITDDDDNNAVALTRSFESKNANKENTIMERASLKRKLSRKEENTCINVHCKSGKNLTKAPTSVITYYGYKTNKKRAEVCSECLDHCLSYYEDIGGVLKEHKPLVQFKSFPVNDIAVVDLESDEETSDPEEPLPPSLLEDFDLNFEEVFNETIERYDLDFQVTESTKYISDKMDALELESKGISDSLYQFQKKIDIFRNLIYKDHEPKREELPSIEIESILFQPTDEPYFAQQNFSSPPLFNSQLRQPSDQPPRSSGVAMKRVTYPPPSQPIPPRPDSFSQEIVAIEQVSVRVTPLPPIGNLTRPKPRPNDIVYVMKMSFFGVWARGRVMDVINEANGAPMIQTLYRVKMEAPNNRKQFSIKTVTGRHLAYPNPAPVRLTVGTRVIAVFNEDESWKQSKGGAYYSGLIAEPPKSNNRFRYLVFFDDGYAQYVMHNHILVVCESSRNVWDDIHPDSREFIRKYLTQYPERPMVKLAPNQVVKTEWNGKWWVARVIEVDGSLVKMSFDADKRTEWIYRGSTRLAPLYNELVHAQTRQDTNTGIRRYRGMGVQRKTNQPYVEYTQNTGVEDEVLELDSSAAALEIDEPAQAISQVRAVAKKSTAKKSEAQIQKPVYTKEAVGNVKEMQLPDKVPMPKRFVPHSCGPKCIDWVEYNPDAMREYNPLAIPLYCGWQREIPKFRKKSVIMYTAPCGRRLRNMEDLHRYLRQCKSKMSVDMFDFDFWVNALSEFTLSERVIPKVVNDDITYGKETVKIKLVNYVDHNVPNMLFYSTMRRPTADVPLNLDKNFLCGCDCTDDCQDKEKCACWQLTFQGTTICNGGVPDPTVGYHYKRLQERVITGIYECNSQCKCSKTCLNRVVQHPLQLQLQLFKTEEKGWGLRCLNDIPKGTFICIYAGYLYTEQAANYEGEKWGDEYLAELDYIEVVERMKEDYESDVEEDLMEDAEKSDGEDESVQWSSSRKVKKDEDYKIGWLNRTSAEPTPADDSIRSRLRKRTSEDVETADDSKASERSSRKRDSLQKNEDDADDDGSDDEKEKRQPSSFTAKPLKQQNQTKRFQSVRKFYGQNERVYIMDANRMGNIGRYLNHSCSPNVFVQNVFVDTHDLRFPWVAFFALTYIKAGEELTWDYNYEVGSVAGKTILCACGSAECRGRLL